MDLRSLINLACFDRHLSKIPRIEQRYVLNIPGPEWSDWDKPGACSVTCGPGKKSSKRKCSILGKCVGEITKISDCNEGTCEKNDYANYLRLYVPHDWLREKSAEFTFSLKIKPITDGQNSCQICNINEVNN